MKDNIIQIDNLSKYFTSGQTGLSEYALKNIHLSIPRGCIYGIIGTSGAGKSTLLRCLTGLETPCEGSVIFDNQEFPYHKRQNLETVRRQMGMVFQHFQLFSSRNVANNIAYPLEISGISTAQTEQRVEELLTLVGLESKKYDYPSQLSGGEKQRVGIARALVSNPRLLLCDEPTSALDCNTTRELLQLLDRLNQQLGLTIIIITHELEVIKQICHRVAVLSKGQIIEEGKVKDVFSRPLHCVTQNIIQGGMDQFPSEFLQKRRPGTYLVRLGFEGNQAKQPVLSHMLKRFNVEANILSGGLDYLQETIIGHLFIELEGVSDEIEHALIYLRSQNIICKVYT